MHTFIASLVQDHPRTEKADAADDALDGTPGRGCVGEPDTRIVGDHRG